MCVSAARCRSPSTATRSTRRSISGWRSRARTRSCRKARSIGPNTVRPGRNYDLGRSQPAARRDRPRKRGGDGLRHLPDGRPLDIVVEDSGESREKSRRARTDPRFLAADRHPAVHAADAADPVPPPRVFRPDADVDRQGDRERPADRRHARRGNSRRPASSSSNGRNGASTSRPRALAGEPPDLPAAVRLLALYEAWLGAADAEEHARIWHEMLRIWADEVFSIGLVAGVPQPVVVSTRLRNVPARGHVQLGPRRAFRHVQAGHVLVRRHAGAGRLGRARPAAGLKARIRRLRRGLLHDPGASRGWFAGSREPDRPGYPARRSRTANFGITRTCGRRAGWSRAGLSVRRIVFDARLSRPSDPDHDPDADRHQHRHLHHHPAAARRLFLDLHRRAAEPGRRRRSRQDRVSEGAVRLRQAAVAAVPLLGRRPAARRYGLFVRSTTCRSTRWSATGCC